MSIIISKGGQNAKKLDRTVIQQEEYLQAYIENNADCLPLHDLKDNFRLLILAREFATPRGGYIDLLGVDVDGDIYIVETKLDQNADKRRIIAQALDYGAALWGNPSELIAKAEETAWRTRLLGILSGDEQAVANCIAAIEQNARAGRFRFVILMDHLDDGLRELISFVNKNSQFKVLGVELDFYSHEGFEIVIPKLYGGESTNDPASAVSPQMKRSGKWDEGSFFAMANQRFGDDGARAMRDLHDRCKAMGGAIKGTDKSFNVTFNGFFKPFYVFYDRGVELDFDMKLKSPEAAAPTLKLKELLLKKGFLDPADRTKSYPRVSVNVFVPRVSDFMESLRESLEP